MSTGKPIVNFDRYINKVLKQVYPNASITEDAKSQVCSFVCTVGAKLAQEANFLANTNFGKSKKAPKPHTLTARDIQSAVRLILSGELTKYAIIEGTKAVTRFTSDGPGTVANPKSAAKRAGLQFPHSRAEKIIRIYHSGRVGKGASVYLAAVLEYLAAEVLELSLNSARDHRRIRIKARDLTLAIENDEELLNLTHNINWEVIGGGELPNIHVVLLMRQKKNKLKNG